MGSRLFTCMANYGPEIQLVIQIIKHTLGYYLIMCVVLPKLLDYAFCLMFTMIYDDDHRFDFEQAMNILIARAAVNDIGPYLAPWLYPAYVGWVARRHIWGAFRYVAHIKI